MTKGGLYITTLLHDITQARYQVKFARDFHGMVRIDFFKDVPIDGNSFYEHEHCGFPGCKRSQLERALIDALIRFKNTYNIPSVTEHDDAV